MTQRGEDEIAAVVADLVGQILEAPADTIGRTSRLAEDLGVDSLSLLELVIGIEEQFGVRIADADVARLGTVDDAVRLIAASV